METHDYTDEMQARRERVVRKLSVAKDKPGDKPDPKITDPEVAGSRWREWASTVALVLAVLLMLVLYVLYRLSPDRLSPGFSCLIFLAIGLIYLAIGPDSQSNSTGGRVGSGDGGGDWGGDGGGDGD